MVQEAEKLKNNCPLSLVVNSITMDECYELIQACIQGTDLFSMQFYWWMIVQLLNATVVFTQLANRYALSNIHGKSGNCRRKMDLCPVQRIDLNGRIHH